MLVRRILKIWVTAGQSKKAAKLTQNDNFDKNFLDRYFIHSSAAVCHFESVKTGEHWTKRAEKKYEANKAAEKAAIVKKEHVFDEIPLENRSKEAFEKAIGLFRERNVHLRGHVEFILAALKRMKEFNVHEDLEIYKKLIDIFPKGKMVSRNQFQAAYDYYPKHQDCCVKLLDQMVFYNVHADKETYKLVESVFGNASKVMGKMKRQMYWMPKIKNANPYPFPKPLPNSEIELAKIIMQRICRDPGNVITTWFTESLPEPMEDTWLVNGQSPLQKDHIKEHPKDEALYVDGPYRAWVDKKHMYYFMLSAAPNREKFYGDVKKSNWHTEEEWASWDNKYSAEFPESRRNLMLMPTIHEQPDGTILALVITGSGTKDSLADWISFLQKENPKLAQIPIVFRISHGTGELISLDGSTRFQSTKNMVETT